MNSFATPETSSIRHVRVDAVLVEQVDAVSPRRLNEPSTVVRLFGGVLIGAPRRRRRATQGRPSSQSALVTAQRDHLASSPARRRNHQCGAEAVLGPNVSCNVSLRGAALVHSDFFFKARPRPVALEFQIVARLQDGPEPLGRPEVAPPSPW